MTNKQLKEFYNNHGADLFNINEVRHLVVNYGIYCLHGGSGSFEFWFSGLSKDWRKIANNVDNSITR